MNDQALVDSDVDGDVLTLIVTLSTLTLTSTVTLLTLITTFACMRLF